MNNSNESTITLDLPKNLIDSLSIMAKQNNFTVERMIQTILHDRVQQEFGRSAS